MATAVREVMKRQRIQRSRKPPRFEYRHGAQELPAEEAQSLLLGVSERYQARSLQRRLERTRKRHEHSPERQSVAIAMLAVEEQIVKALWTIARQPLGKTLPAMLSRCGLDYIHDRSDIHSIYADAAGGKWDSVAPRPALPSAKDISAADRVQQWLLLIPDEALRKLLVVGATSKRGDAGRQVNWTRLRQGMPEIKETPVRTLNFRYQEALRIIVAELTVARVG